MREKGTGVYLNALELAAIEKADDHLTSLLESADAESAIADLQAAKVGLHSIMEKVHKSRRSSARRSTVKAALRVAEKDEDFLVINYLAEASESYKPGD